MAHERWVRVTGVPWSWPAVLALAGGALVGACFAMSAGSEAQMVLVGSGVALAFAGVAAHIFGTWRMDRQH